MTSLLPYNSDAFVAPTAVRSPLQQQQARSSRSHVVSMAATAEKPADTKKAADVPGGVMTLSRYMLDQARLNTDYQVRPAVAVVGWWWLGLVCVFGVYVCNVYVEWACCAGKEGAPRRGVQSPCCAAPTGAPRSVEKEYILCWDPV